MRFEVVGLTYDFQPLIYANVLLSLVRPYDSNAFIRCQFIHEQVRYGGDTDPNALDVKFLGCLMQLAVNPTDLETVSILWFPVAVIDRRAASGLALRYRFSPQGI